MLVGSGTSNAATLYFVFSFWYIVALVNAADCPVLPANGHQEFADHLTTELYLLNGDDDNTNQCSSALGISFAFSLIYPGAIDDAENQIRQVFGYPVDSQKTLVWGDISTRLDDTYEGRCPGEDQFPDECFLTEPAVEIANRIWVREGVGLDESYQAIVGDLVQELDFSNDQAGNNINTWASENTNGLIDQIVQNGPLPADWILVATNSLYMKASWLWQFQEFRTSQDDFYLSSGEISENQAHFMHMVEHFEYSHDALSGFQVIKLPFAGDGPSNGLSMLFVLPISTEEGISNAVASSVDVIDSLPKLERTKIALSIPKYKYETSYQSDLMDSLKTIGVVAPFSGGLCVMDGDCSSAIDVVIQKTVIDVNEKGVEAAAVTLIGVATSLPPPEPITLFLADHPFQFFIHDSNENLILFEGIVKDPGIPEGSTAPLGTANQRDMSFWTETFFIDEPIQQASSSSSGQQMSSDRPECPGVIEQSNTEDTKPGSESPTASPIGDGNTDVSPTAEPAPESPTATPSSDGSANSLWWSASLAVLFGLVLLQSRY